MLPITPNEDDTRLGKIRGPQEEILFRTKGASWGLRLLTTFWLEVPPYLTSAWPGVFSLLRVLAWKPPSQVSRGLTLGHRFNLLGENSHGSGQQRKATNSCWLLTVKNGWCFSVSQPPTSEELTYWILIAFLTPWKPPLGTVWGHARWNTSISNCL